MLLAKSSTTILNGSRAKWLETAVVLTGNAEDVDIVSSA